MSHDVTKGDLCRENQIELCIALACSRGHSTGHFDAKIRCLAQFLTELLRFFSFKTCIMNNDAY